MPSTHVSLHYHLIYSTKDRYQWIDAQWEKRLHAFLGGAVRKCGGVAQCIGGTDDHVHLLVGLKATHCVADVLCEIKSSSSGWVKGNFAAVFGWQDGYGAFTVSPSGCEAVAKYIREQRDHHRKKTFKQEYREFLVKCGVKFDERYLW